MAAEKFYMESYQLGRQIVVTVLVCAPPQPLTLDSFLAFRRLGKKPFVVKTKALPQRHEIAKTLIAPMRAPTVWET